MINLKLSSKLTIIAELLKFDTPVNREILNLSRAARSIRDHEGDVYELYKNNSLKLLPGIDSYSYSLIDEYFKDRKIKILEDIRQKYSEDLLKIVRISGIGSKNAFPVFDRLNIKDYRDIKEIFSGQYDLEDIVKKTGSSPNIIKRIAYSSKYFDLTSKGIPRWYASNIAKKIIKQLSSINEIRNIDLVGSFRRKKPIVNDLDILIVPYFNKGNLDLEKTIDLLDKISKSDFAKSVISENIKKENASYILESIFGIDIEIIITSEKMWLNDYISCTGNKKHIKDLKRIAKDASLIKNGNISSEKLLFSDEKTEIGSEKIYKKELEFFKLIGLQYIPPELREGRDEIMLAKDFKIPDLVDIKDIKGDLHIHSVWSDGVLATRELIEKIKQKDYEYIALSDHSVSNKYGNGLSKEKLYKKIKYIDSLKKRKDMPYVLMGSEIEIKDPIESEYDSNILKNLDIAIASMHRGYLSTKDDNTEKITKAIRNKYIDIIAHPTGSVFGSRAPHFLDMGKVIESASRYNKALEINSYFLRLDLNEENARKARKGNVLITINTDTHRINNLDMIILGVDIARRAGCEKKDILNTKSLKQIIQWKKER